MFGRVVGDDDGRRTEVHFRLRIPFQNLAAVLFVVFGMYLSFANGIASVVVILPGLLLSGFWYHGCAQAVRAVRTELRAIERANAEPDVEGHSTHAA